MNDSWKLRLTCSAVLFAMACSPPPSMPDVSSSEDASLPPADVSSASDAATPDAAAAVSCTDRIPTSNYCSTVGCRVRPFELVSCDEGATGPYSFYNEEFCRANATVVIVAAGWCMPCMIEAPMIEELITVPYRERGVRVLTVYGQNPNYGTPTVAACNQWRERYGLTSQMTADPMAVTQGYFPNMAFPANLVVDRHGRIVFRQYGTQTGLTDLINAVEQALEAP